MGTSVSLEEFLRNTRPKTYHAANVVADAYLNQTPKPGKTVEDLLGDLGTIRNGDSGNAYSNGVHRAAEWAGYGVGAGLTAGGIAGGYALGTALGGALGGAIGGFLGAAVGAMLGAALAGLVTAGIEFLGKALAGALGIDFHSHGTTPGGASWERVDHPDGSWERTERGGSFDVIETGKPGGAYTQDIHGKGDAKGFDSSFRDDGKGHSSYVAVDKQGGVHMMGQGGFVTANAHDTDRSNGKSGFHVSWTDGHGNGSSSWRYNDGSHKETHDSRKQNADGTTTDTRTTTEKDKNGHVTSQDTTSTTKDNKGNTTTQSTHTDSHGHSSSKTESKDAHGNKNEPPNPPPHRDSGRDNPDSGQSEGPPVRPGDLGAGRPGHPMDHLVPPGSWRKDNGEWEGEQPPRMRDLLAAAGWTLRTDWNLGHGDAAEESRKEDLRNKLKGYEVKAPASGEDFIHPKARAGMLLVIAQAVLRNHR